MGELKKTKMRKNTNVDERDPRNNRNGEEDEDSPKAKSIHLIMRPDDDSGKITEQEKKNWKKQFLQVMNEFPEDEGGFEDS